MNLKSLNKLYYHRYEFVVETSGEMFLHYWSGGLIRNNLLKAALKVKLELSERQLEPTLFDFIEESRIEDIHPFYNEFKEGHPKGNILLPQIPNQKFGKIYLQKGDSFTFQLTLVGIYNDFLSQFIKAIKIMCCEGIGSPRVPLTLKTVSEIDEDQQRHMIKTDRTENVRKPKYRIRFSDFSKAEFEKTRLMLYFQTPTLITREKDEYTGSFTFYQIMKSLTERALTLSHLYCSSTLELFTRDRSALEKFLEPSKHLQVRKTNMFWHYFTQPKSKQDEPLKLTGATGWITFEGKFNRYVPLLLFCEALHLGRNITYGCGKYSIEKPFDEVK